MCIMDVTTQKYTAENAPPIGIKLEREATLMDFNISKGPPRPLTSSPMSEPPTSPLPIFSPVPEYPPATQRKPSQADTDELLEFIRNKQNKKGLTMEREPTISWTEKKETVITGYTKISKSSKTGRYCLSRIWSTGGYGFILHIWIVKIIGEHSRSKS